MAGLATHDLKFHIGFERIACAVAYVHTQVLLRFSGEQVLLVHEHRCKLVFDVSACLIFGPEGAFGISCTLELVDSALPVLRGQMDLRNFRLLLRAVEVGVHAQVFVILVVLVPQLGTFRRLFWR